MAGWAGQWCSVTALLVEVSASDGDLPASVRPAPSVDAGAGRTPARKRLAAVETVVLTAGDSVQVSERSAGAVRFSGGWLPRAAVEAVDGAGFVGGAAARTGGR
jgi:hypothetical protein